MKTINWLLAVALFLFLNCVYASLPDDLMAYTCKNANFGKLNLSTGFVTQGDCPPGYWDLDFAPDGTLYGLSRSTDALYRITDPENGRVELLASLPENSGGDPVAVSPDGNYLYFTAGFGSSPRTLYRYNINTDYITTAVSSNRVSRFF